MGRKFDGVSNNEDRIRLTPSFSTEQNNPGGVEDDQDFDQDLDARFHDDAKDKDKDQDKDKTDQDGKQDGGAEEEGQQGGEASGGGGGPVDFDQTEHDFDQTELQGLSLPIFRRALKKGIKLVSRVTKQSEHYLRNFLPDASLRSKVLEVALSEKGFPTLLLDKGEIVQYQLSQGKLDRVRVSPDLDAERAVKYAMAGFIAAGESIDPKHVKFGRSPEFEARMKPIWVQEWKRMQKEDKNLRLDGMRKDMSFRRAVETQAPTRQAAEAQAAAARAASSPMQQSRAGESRAGEPATSGDRPRIDIPRAGSGGGNYEPQA